MRNIGLKPFTFILGQHSFNNQPIYFVKASDTLIIIIVSLLLLLFNITAGSVQRTEEAFMGSQVYPFAQ